MPDAPPPAPRSPALSHRVRRGLRRRWLLEAALYGALAVASTWPLARRMASALPTGTEPCATVALFNLWTLWWNVDSIERFYHGYWAAPIFHPTEDTLAFSEPQTLTGIVAAPFWWLFPRSPFAYNAILLLALMLNGWAACRLLQALRLRWVPALAGGAVVEMLPFIHWQLGILQLVPLVGVLWTSHALVRFAQRPGVGRGLLVGLALAATYHLCAYYGLFLAVLLFIVGVLVAAAVVIRLLWFALRRETARLRRETCCRLASWPLAFGVGLAALLILPVALVQMRVTRQHDFERPLSWVTELSAPPYGFRTTPWPQLVTIPGMRYGADAWALCPGTLKLALAALGFAYGVSRRRRRVWTAAATAVLLVAALLAMGPPALGPLLDDERPALGIDLGRYSPYGLLADYCPGFAQIRNIFRFAVFSQLAVALLAALGLQAAGRAARWLAGKAARAAPKMRRRLLAAAGAPLLAVGGLAAAEIWPPPQPLYEPPSFHHHRAWIGWLEEHTPAGSVVLCAPFPLPEETSAQSYLGTVEWMYLGIAHERPMVNGYSGFFPERFIELKRVMGGFPDEASLDLLARAGVQYCVVRRSYLTRSAIEPAPGSGRLRWLFGDDRAAVDIYRLER